MGVGLFPLPAPWGMPDDLGVWADQPHLPHRSSLSPPEQSITSKSFQSDAILIHFTFSLMAFAMAGPPPG